MKSSKITLGVMIMELIVAIVIAKIIYSNIFSTEFFSIFIVAIWAVGIGHGKLIRKFKKRYIWLISAVCMLVIPIVFIMTIPEYSYSEARDILCEELDGNDEYYIDETMSGGHQFLNNEYLLINKTYVFKVIEKDIVNWFDVDPQTGNVDVIVDSTGE